MHSLQKPEPAQRCDEYLLWIRSQPSVVSGQRFCVSHHVVGGRFSTRKTSDFLAIPLTNDEHLRLHANWPAWEELYGLQRYHSERMLLRAEERHLIARSESGGIITPNRRALIRAAQSEEFAA